MKKSFYSIITLIIGAVLLLSFLPIAASSDTSSVGADLLSVDSNISQLSCTDTECDVEYTVNVTNNTDTSVNNFSLTNVLNDSVFNYQASILDSGVSGQFSSFNDPTRLTSFEDGSTGAQFYNGVYVQTDGGYLYGAPNGQSGNYSTMDTAATNPLSRVYLDAVGDVKKVLMTSNATLLLTEDGRVYSWGDPASNLTGRASTGASLYPEEIPELSSLNIVDIYMTEDPTNAQAFALTSDGHVYSWGSSVDKLGRAGTASIPAIISNLSNVEKLVLKPSISGAYAITTSGQVYTWGSGASYSNGTSSTATVSTPTLIGGDLTGVVVEDIYPRPLGGAYAVSNNGVVYFWGSSGQYAGIANDNTTSYTTPTIVSGTSSYHVNKIIFGTLSKNVYTVFALTDEGALLTWGSNANYGLGSTSSDHYIPFIQSTEYVGTNPIVDVVLRGYSGGYALSSTGDVYTWGVSGGSSYYYNSNNSSSTVETPVKLTTISNVVKLVSQGQGAFAITSSGEVYTLGKVTLSNGTSIINLTPTLMSGLTGHVITDVSESGMAYSSSTGEIFKITNATTALNLFPSQMSKLNDVTGFYGVSSNGGYSINSDGEVYSWGLGVGGRLGNGDTTLANQPYAAKVDIPGFATKVIANGNTVYALTSDGKIYAWGTNNSGSLGNNNAASIAYSPALVQGLSSEVVTDIYPSSTAIYALTQSGKVYSWGSNTSGVSGYSISTSVATPVSGLSNVIVSKVYPRANGAYVLTTAGEVYSWGAGTNYANGNNNTGILYSAEIVQGLPVDGIKDIVVKTDSLGAFAISNSGKVYAWGIGTNGVNGDQETTDNPIANNLSKLNGVIVTQISPRVNGAYALTSTGNVWSWGEGTGYVNGTSSESANSEPIQINGLFNITHVYMGEYSEDAKYSYALSSTGSLYRIGVTTTPQVQPGLENVTVSQFYSDNLDENSVSAAYNYSSFVAIDSNGKAYTWGYRADDTYSNSLTNTTTAKATVGLETKTVKDVKVTLNGIYYLLKDNTVWSKGSQASNTGVENTNYMSRVQPALAKYYSNNRILAVPSTESNSNGYNRNTYTIPHLAAGESTNLIISGTISKTLVSQDIFNQVYVNSTNTQISDYISGGNSTSVPYLPSSSTSGIFNSEVVGCSENITVNGDLDSYPLCTEVGIQISAAISGGTITGKVWTNDFNNSSYSSSTSQLESGITVTLYQNTNQIAQTTTNSLGEYSFNNVLPNNYTVSFSTPETGDSGTQYVPVDAVNDYSLSDVSQIGNYTTVKNTAQNISVTNGNTIYVNAGFYSIPSGFLLSQVEGTTEQDIVT